MARSRQNFLTGTVDDSPLSLGATLLTSTGLDDMNTIANPTTAVIVLDPQRVHGAQEIIIVTAHTTGQRTATVLRGQLGTTQRDHPTGTVWVQPMLVDDPAFLDQANSFSALNTFTAGMKLSGSVSGYTDELQFTTTTASGSHAISTLDTGNAHMRFDHRGAANTGDWYWANGTNAATTLMTLSSVGLLAVNGGVDIQGSPTGAYATGELRFPSTLNQTAGNGMGITTLATGSPRFYFDHRATSNTGDFVWRNGTGGATTLMSLSGVGLLNASGGFDATGSPSGFNGGEYRFNISTASATSAISTVATGTPSIYFNHRGTGNTGDFHWTNGSGGANSMMTLDGAGNLAVAGTNSKFGTGSFGAAGAFARLGDQGDASNTYFIADGSGSNVGLLLRSKGTSQVLVQTAGGTTIAGFDPTTTSIHLGSSVTLPTSLSSVFAISQIGVAVSGTPSSGGWLWVENGGLKYKGSSGTVTVIAPA